MVEWRTKPRLDSGSGAGFQLIVVGYGVILITVPMSGALVFPADLADLRSNGIPGLLHLLLAATMLVISWMGVLLQPSAIPRMAWGVFQHPAATVPDIVRDPVSVLGTGYNRAAPEFAHVKGRSPGASDSVR